MIVTFLIVLNHRHHHVQHHMTIKVCEALLDAGADAAAQSGEECSVLHYLVQVAFDPDLDHHHHCHGDGADDDQ